MNRSASSLDAPQNRASSEATELELRRLTSQEDYAKAVELQRLTWGAAFQEIVPAAILKVSQRVGGVTAGAFAPDGTLYGFVYGLTGFYDGRCVHWSHMLGVRSEARNLGIGRQLKEYQRKLLVEAGVEWMYWTFDPLIARNAHFNLNRLRVEVREYVPDMYGDTGSDLHAFGTDRLVVAWPVSREGPARVYTNGVPAVNAPVINDFTDHQLEVLGDAVVRIEIPRDIEALSIEEARAWRGSSRRCFLSALQRGYRVTTFHTTEDRSFYVLTSK